MPRNAKSRRRGMLFRSLSFLLIRSSFRSPSIGPSFNSKCCSIAQYPAAVRRFVQLKLLATGIDRKNALGAVVGRRWWTRLDQYWAPAVGTRCLVYGASRRFLVSLKQTWEKEWTNEKNTRRDGRSGAKGKLADKYNDHAIAILRSPKWLRLNDERYP